MDDVNPTVHGNTGGNVDNGHGVGQISDDKPDGLNVATSAVKGHLMNNVEWRGTEAFRPEEEFEGYWLHEKQPDMVEFIQGCTITSCDGTVTKLKTQGPGVFSIKFQGRREYARHD